VLKLEPVAAPLARLLTPAAARQTGTANHSSRRTITRTTTERLVVEDDYQEKGQATPLAPARTFSDMLGGLFGLLLAVLAAGFLTGALFVLFIMSSAIGAALMILIGIVMATGSYQVRKDIGS
jgi:predicted lipid-binding transport protein (Tim44 family)